MQKPVGVQVELMGDCYHFMDSLTTSEFYFCALKTHNILALTFEIRFMLSIFNYSLCEILYSLNFLILCHSAADVKSDGFISLNVVLGQSVHLWVKVDRSLL